jgi:hypothetical protein
VYPGWPDTFNNFFFDARCGHFALYLRPRIHAGKEDVNRLVARTESDDLLHWDLEEVVLDTDAGDAPAVGTVYDGGDWQKGVPPDAYPRGRNRQFYGLTVKPYRDLYLGMALVLDAVAGTLWNELVYSFDGIQWRREPRRDALIDREPGGWQSAGIGFVAAGCPLLLGDELLFYFSASNILHHNLPTQRWLEQLRTGQDRGCVRGIGRATVPRGRLIGYHAGEETGELLTKPFTATKGELSLNVDVRHGKAVVQVTDEHGLPVLGFTFADSLPMTANGFAEKVRFGSDNRFSRLAGKRVRLRIQVSGEAVYGFRIQKE